MHKIIVKTTIPEKFLTDERHKEHVKREVALKMVDQLLPHIKWTDELWENYGPRDSRMHRVIAEVYVQTPYEEETTSKTIL